jgi:hypothetical protein
MDKKDNNPYNKYRNGNLKTQFITHNILQMPTSTQIIPIIPIQLENSNLFLFYFFIFFYYFYLKQFSFGFIERFKINRN